MWPSKPEADAAEQLPPSASVRTDIPSMARVYDYYLGGKDNFPVDRQAAENILALSPAPRQAALANRAFLHRVVRHLAEQGIDQFLDLGAGIPTSPNTHEVAQAVRPDARVVYVDNDPIVLAHARARLVSSAHGATAIVDGDARDPERILAQARATGALDFSRPVGLLLLALFHFVPADDEPQAIVSTLVDALAPGSFVALSHVTSDFSTPEQARQGTADYNRLTSRLFPRSHAELSDLLAGLELAEPGIVPAPLWHPDREVTEPETRMPIYAVLARKGA
jgi:SAM-dependent methyltransferase